MKTKIFIITLILITQFAFTQRFVSKNAYIRIYSYTPVEVIEGINNQVVSIIDGATGDIQFSLLVKSFEFKRELMGENFNENYMESSQFPKASFKGKIKDSGNVDLKKDGIYPVEVIGDLTIHGVTKAFTTTGTIEVVEGKPIAKSKFVVIPKDFNINVPELVQDKIAKDIEITIEAAYLPN